MFFYSWLFQLGIDHDPHELLRNLWSLFYLAWYYHYLEDNRIIEGHTDWVTCLCVWRDTLFSGSSDMSIIKWNDSSISQQLKQHTSSVLSLVVFNDHLWSCGYDRVMIEWDWNCNVIRKFNYTLSFIYLTVFDNMIFSGHYDGSIIGWVGMLFIYIVEF